LPGPTLIVIRETRRVPETASSQSEAGAAPAVDSDLRCTGCGYNLHGLSRDGVCPECGLEIRRSIGGQRLQYADPQWLGKLRHGTQVLILCLIVPVLGALAIMLLVPIAINKPEALQLSMLALGLVWVGLWLRAMHLVTAQEPRVALQERAVSLRKVIFICSVVAALGQLLDQTDSFVDLPAWLRIAGELLTFPSIVVIIGLGVYFRGFALRIPDPSLARNTKTVVVGWCIVVGAAVLLGLGTLLLVFYAPAPPTTAGQGGLQWSFMDRSGPMPLSGPSTVLLTGAICGLAIGFVVFGIWTLALLCRYVKVFSETLEQAKLLAANTNPQP
jgi:predicted RNA-binding Zn-ribbon protein involved in translation (DUF1610 family)